MSVGESGSFVSELVLRVRNLCKLFGGVSAVDDVSFEASAGLITAMIGPNGAGKTTVFNLVTNILRADRGEVHFCGRSLMGISPVKIAGMGLIRTFQSARVFPGMTALENVMMGAHRLSSHGALSQMLRLPAARREESKIRLRAEAMLELADLAQYRNAHAAELPMGVQKLLEVLRALCASPTLLCLDEPAAGLNDTETVELARLLRAVRAIGTSVLLVEHNMALVMHVADHIVVLDAGRVISRGNPDFVRNDDRVIKAYLGSGPHAAS